MIRFDFIVLAISLSSTSALAQSVDRAAVNAQLVGSPTLTEQEMRTVLQPNPSPKFGNMRYIHPVMKGLLYRAGGKGGAHPLGDGELNALCGLGFSAVDYAYDGQKPTTISCGSNSYTYQTVPYSPRQAGVFLSHIYNAVRQNLGPVMIHCWNGWHESGLMSVYALIQFCGSKGWNATTGWEYWRSTTGDNPDNPQYLGIKNMINSFQRQAGMDLTPTEINDLCPSTR